MGTEQVLIPMPMRALLVGEPQDYYADMTYNYSSLEGKPLGDNIEPNHRSKKENSDRGIHLHWILPEAMKHGSQDDKEEDIIYPEVPNHWQITRLWTSSNPKDDKVYSLSWVVESDVLQKSNKEEYGNLMSPQFPVLNDFTRQYRYLGRSYKAEKTPPLCEEVLERLTATAPGQPAFSAFYPACRNVFGFCDDMLDSAGKYLEKVNVTYVICGWYMNPDRDIIKGKNSKDECLEKLGWNIPEGTSFPAQSICHSILGGIFWESRKTKYESNIPKEDPDISVGNTTAEALAALAERKNPNNNLERMLNLFYSSGEMLLRGKNGLMNGEVKLHQDRFGKQSPLVQYAFKEKAGTEKTGLNEIFPKEDIDKLNNDLVKLIQKTAELENQQEAVFDCWYKYVLLGQKEYFNKHEKELAKEWQKNYLNKIDQIEKSINKLKEEKNILEEAIAKAEKTIPDKLTNYSMIALNDQEYWTPNEPVLLLGNVKRDYLCTEYERQEEEKGLFCRTAKQLIKRLTVDKLEGAFSDPTHVTAEELSIEGNLPTSIKPFVMEALLICPDFAEKLASIMLKKRECLNETNLTALTRKIKDLQSAFKLRRIYLSVGREKLSAASGFDGILPDRTAAMQYSKPWAPLFIRWSINYFPDPAIIEDEPSLRNWDMKENLADFKYKNEKATSKVVPIQGVNILAPNGSLITAGCVGRILCEHGMASDALDMDVLSQAFGGINSSCIMISHDLLLPIEYVNTGKINLGDWKLPLDKLITVLKGYNPGKSNYDEFFSPVRGGFIQIDKIDIVDSYGQLKEIERPSAAVAENMRNNSNVKQRNIMLTPRLIQPSRINFKWLNPDNDLPLDEYRGESPICGWLLPNHTDKSIMVYDNEGNLLGSLQRVNLDEPVVWKDIPQNGGRTIPLPKTMNTTLYNMLSVILNYSRENKYDLLTPIINVIDSSFWNINPDAAQQYNCLGLYVGRPVIVTNSSLMLEQMEIPKSHKHMDTEKYGPYSNIDVKKAKFQVQIGKTNNHCDGVICFFENDDFEKMKITSESKPNNNEYFSTDNSITLSLSDLKATKITVLMDFSASIDLISGFLPTKTIRPDSGMISAALDKLFLTIFSAPVLGDNKEFSIPLPKLEGKKWTWLHSKDLDFKEDDIFKSTSTAYFPVNGVSAQEGWLRLMLNGTENE